MVPDWPPAGSRMMAATSPDSKADLDGLDVVGWAHHHVFQGTCRHPRGDRRVVRRVDAHGDGVVPAVEVARELHDLRAPRVGAGQAQGEVRGLGARHGEARQLPARNEAVDQLGPADLQLVAAAHVGDARHLLLHGLDHRGMAVADEERPVAHPVVDILVAVDVPLVAAQRPRHVRAEREQVADVVGDAARNGLAGALGQGGRLGMLGPVLLEDGHGSLAFLREIDRGSPAAIRPRRRPPDSLHDTGTARETGLGGHAKQAHERHVNVEAERVHGRLTAPREAIDGARRHARLDQPALLLRGVEQGLPGEPAQRRRDAVRAPVRHAGHHEVIGADHRRRCAP